jgi:hypothetical protein
MSWLSTGADFATIATGLSAATAAYVWTQNQVRGRRQEREARTAATVLEAATALVAVGVSKDTQICDSNVAEVKQTLRSVPGVGYATTNYFLMLLGRPGVKPDRMVHRFLEEACGHRFADARAEEVVTDTAVELGVQVHELDHAIWKFESDRARQ